MNIQELIVILFFGFLLISQIFNYIYRRLKSNTIIEGAQNQNVSQSNTKPVYTYDEYIGLQNTDPLFLAIKNASNIAFLKSQIDDITNIRQEMNKMNSDIQSNTTQIESIQQSLIDDLNPPEETGENAETEEGTNTQGGTSQEGLTTDNKNEDTNVNEED